MTLDELKKTLHKGAPTNPDGSRITYEQARKQHHARNVDDTQPVHVDATIDEILALGFIPMDEALNKILKQGD